MNTEMISIPGLLAFAVTVAVGLGLGWLYRLGCKPEIVEPEEPAIRDLAEAAVRSELTAFLQKRNVVGDADIRQGVVYAPVPPERLEPLSVVLENAAAMISRLRNPGACSIYVRDSVNDRFMLLSDLDLQHLLDASRVMNRVAEDRLKRMKEQTND